MATLPPTVAVFELMRDARERSYAEIMDATELTHEQVVLAMLSLSNMGHTWIATMRHRLIVSDDAQVTFGDILTHTPGRTVG